MGCHPDVGSDEVVLKFVEQVGFFAQQLLVAGAGVEGEQRKGALVDSVYGNASLLDEAGGQIATPRTSKRVRWRFHKAGNLNNSKHPLTNFRTHTINGGLSRSSSST